MTESPTPPIAQSRKLAKVAVAREADRIAKVSGKDLIQADGRFASNHQHALGILFDWSRQRIDAEAWSALESLAEAWKLDEFIQAVAQGEIVNSSENRSAMHMALRVPFAASKSQVESQLFQDRREFLEFADSVRNGVIRGFDGGVFTDFVHIGIGGSHLGPALVCDALSEGNYPKAHFCSNADRRALKTVLAEVTPHRTLFIVASKSYSTHETLENAKSVRSWLYERIDPATDISQHFVHVTSNRDLDMGSERVFRIPETIGGRFSLWSAMGLPIALSLGSAKFLELLEGAHEMDRQVLSSRLSLNVAARTALLTLWNASFLGASSHLVLPYDSRLKLLPAYCQQLEMESNGKSVGNDNELVSHGTSPVVWGGLETDGQHAWHQFLHQGTQDYSADIIATLETLPSHSAREIQQWILANAIAQGNVMLRGNKAQTKDIQKTIRGNHGSTLILLEKLDARTLGALLAMYEHKTACLGHLWGVNSFDQWGVEEGKHIAGRLNAALRDKSDEEIDSSTADLLRTIRARFETR